jgi:hypothetical protein
MFTVALLTTAKTVSDSYAILYFLNLEQSKEVDAQTWAQRGQSGGRQGNSLLIIVALSFMSLAGFST